MFWIAPHMSAVISARSRRARAHILILIPIMIHNISAIADTRKPTYRCPQANKTRPAMTPAAAIQVIMNNAVRHLLFRGALVGRARPTESIRKRSLPQAVRLIVSQGNASGLQFQHQCLIIQGTNGHAASFDWALIIRGRRPQYRDLDEILRLLGGACLPPRCELATRHDQHDDNEKHWPC